jgi:hypothetical protein
LSFNTTFFKEKQNHENLSLVLVTLLISMVHGAATLVGGEPRGLEHVEFGIQDRWLPPVTSFEDFSVLLDWSCWTVERDSITSLNLWSTLLIPAYHKSFTGFYTLVDTRVKVEPTRLVNTYPTQSISLFDWDTSQSIITLATFAQFFKKIVCIGQKNVFKSKKWQYNCQEK